MYYRRGLARKELGRVSEALEDFKAADVLNPSNNDIVKEIRLCKKLLNPTVKAVVAYGDCFDKDISEREIIVESFDDWEKCEIPTLVGIPLVMKPASQLGIFVSTSVKVQMHRSIYFMCESSDGLAPKKWQGYGTMEKIGPLVFCRTDGVPFTITEFFEVFDFVYSMMDHYGDSEGTIIRQKFFNATYYAKFQKNRKIH